MPNGVKGAKRRMRGLAFCPVAHILVALAKEARNHPFSRYCRKRLTLVAPYCSEGPLATTSGIRGNAAWQSGVRGRRHAETCLLPNDRDRLPALRNGER